MLNYLNVRRSYKSIIVRRFVRWLEMSMAGNVNPDLAEYNAFGPWVYEIDDAHPLPPLFASCFTDNDEAILKIKVPREIERRNAAPGMELYDFVIALYEDI